jgi:hypothetical protein
MAIRREPKMSRRKNASKPEESEPQFVQIVFRISRDQRAAVQAAATGLGLDLSNLLRMMIFENVAEYIERGKKAAALLEQARQASQATTTRRDVPLNTSRRQTRSVEIGNAQ